VGGFSSGYLSQKKAANRFFQGESIISVLGDAKKTRGGKGDEEGGGTDRKTAVREMRPVRTDAIRMRRNATGSPRKGTGGRRKPGDPYSCN